MFANNDARCHANKKRALGFAKRQAKACVLIPATDTPTPQALKLDPSLGARRIEWLKRNDAETGRLYGVLPLAVDMPVALADHLDRAPDKQLLRGTVGFVDSWVLHPDERSTPTPPGVPRRLTHRPLAVFVRFGSGASATAAPATAEAEGAEDAPDSEVSSEAGDAVGEATPADSGAREGWRLPGLRTRGLYPVEPVTRSWHLDKGRKPRPLLEVKRVQYPLSPAFALTAHAAQGKTMDCIVDLQVPAESSPITAYVALSRVKDRSRVLILRPFRIGLFRKGNPIGPNALLQHLRGELEPEAFREQYEARALCSSCQRMHPVHLFSPAEWVLPQKKCARCVAAASGPRATGVPGGSRVRPLWGEADAVAAEASAGRDDAGDADAGGVSGVGVGGARNLGAAPQPRVDTPSHEHRDEQHGDSVEPAEGLRSRARALECPKIT